jgi:hypothetical protein
VRSLFQLDCLASFLAKFQSITDSLILRQTLKKLQRKIRPSAGAQDAPTAGEVPPFS